jgi:hypothetical protein
LKPQTKTKTEGSCQIQRIQQHWHLLTYLLTYLTERCMHNGDHDYVQRANSLMIPTVLTGSKAAKADCYNIKHVETISPP